MASVHSSLQPRDRGTRRGAGEKESSGGSRAPGPLPVDPKKFCSRRCGPPLCVHLQQEGEAETATLFKKTLGAGVSRPPGSSDPARWVPLAGTWEERALQEEGGRRAVAAAEATAGPEWRREAGPAGTARRPRSRRQASGKLAVCTGPSVSLPQGTRRNSITHHPPLLTDFCLHF